MSFDLAVLALATDDSRTARQQFERCLDGSTHVEGELDERIVAFYKQLQAIHPDHDAAVYENDCPWSSAPLDVGIDHVIMNMSFGSHSTPVIETVLRLAALHGLAVYDPQSDDTYLG